MSKTRVWHGPAGPQWARPGRANPRQPVFEISNLIKGGDGSTEVVFIKDMCTGEQLSVTNGAEEVVLELNGLYPDARIIYRDTEGHWDELVHDQGFFQYFRPLTPEDQTKYKEHMK